MLEALIVRLKRIGFREEYLPAVTHNGERIPGVKVYHDLKTDLQCATKLLSINPQAQCTNLSNATGGTLNVSEAQTGGTQLQQRTGVSCTQQQQVPAGGGGASFTPHQFGLTPFQSMCKHDKKYSFKCSLSCHFATP